VPPRPRAPTFVHAASDRYGHIVQQPARTDCNDHLGWLLSSRAFRFSARSSVSCQSQLAQPQSLVSTEVQPFSVCCGVVRIGLMRRVWQLAVMLWADRAPPNRGSINSTHILGTHV